MTELRKNIKAVAKSEGLTEIEAITLMQTGAAKIGAEKMLSALCKIKMEYVEKML